MSHDFYHKTGNAIMNSLFPVVILAGGLGTRLQPFTAHTPKILVPVLHQPFVLHQLHLLKQKGIKKILFCIGYQGQQIEKVVGDGTPLGLEIQYHYDGDALLGTAGAIRAALPQLAESFFILYGDAYLPCDYHALQQAFLASHQPALMSVFKNQNAYDRSNVLFKNNCLLAYNKAHPTPDMQHIDYGLGLFHRAIFESLPLHQPYDLATLYQDLAEKKQLAAYEVTERFYEVGSWRGILDLENHLKEKSHV